jgi:DNA primase
VFNAKERITALSTFLFDDLSAKADLSSIDGRAQLVALARPLITKVPPGPLRQLLGQHLEKLAGTTIRGTDEPAPPVRKPPPQARPHAPGRYVPSLLTRAIAMLVRQPTLAPLARDLPALDVATNPESALLVTLLERLEGNPDISSGALLESFREGPQAALLTDILAQPLLLEGSHWAAEFTGAIEQMLKRSRRGEITRRVMTRLAPGPGADPQPEDDSG